MADDLLKKLKRLARGLLYPSDTDAPLEAFVWEAASNTAAEVRRLSGEAAQKKCRAASLKSFFAQAKEVEGFAELAESLGQTLTGLKVYRFGAPDVNVYVVGKAPDGRLAGYKTLSVET